MSNTSSLSNKNPISEILDAAAARQWQRFALDEAAFGPFVIEPGVRYGLGGPKGSSMIAFPELPDETAGAVLDEILAFFTARRPEKSVGLWSHTPARTPELAARLLARGFRTGWCPFWMALELGDWSDAPFRAPDGVEVSADFQTTFSPTPELPYDCAGNLPTSLSRRFVARKDGAVVGHVVVLLPDDDSKTAGIYSVGVVPSARKTGIGRAACAAACAFAKESGCVRAVLNATGRTMYEAIGFRHVGDGVTFWLDPNAFAHLPVAPVRVAFLEAVGRGDTIVLTQMARDSGFDATWLNEPGPNKLSPIELAVAQKQPESVRALMSVGAILDALPAWESGWRAEAETALREHPGRKDRRYGEHGATLLHIAVERNDSALLELGLKHGVDAGVRDTTWTGTPIDWARVIGRPQLLARLEQTV